MTKGQYSPTSRIGTSSPSTPNGSIDRPLQPVEFALGANATFIARTIDTQQRHMPEVLIRAHGHRGAAFVEIFQNCIVYNDAVFAGFSDKKAAPDNQLHLQHGEPMIFGSNSDKGIRLVQGKLELEIVEIGKNDVTENDLLVHDETNRVLAGLLGRMLHPDFPVPIGVIYCEAGAACYTEDLYAEVKSAKEKSGAKDLTDVLQSGATWTVK